MCQLANGFGGKFNFHEREFQATASRAFVAKHHFSRMWNSLRPDNDAASGPIAFGARREPARCAEQGVVERGPHFAGLTHYRSMPWISRNPENRAGRPSAADGAAR